MRGGGIRCSGPAALGVARESPAPDTQRGDYPVVDDRTGLVFAAAGRVDNRPELVSELNLGAGVTPLADSELLRLAYLRWGESCPVKIFGDWSFAAWDPVARRMFLARDHHGNTALYYHCSSRVFAFASSRGALLSMGLAPREMDELYWAQLLIAWPAYQGERTVHRGIKRVPPAHSVAVTERHEEVRRYWFLEDTPEVRLSHRSEYPVALREVFDRAVRDRLPGTAPVGVTLSGGLDSGSVTATAASLLREEGRRLTAFTSVPLFGVESYVGERFGDELPFARRTADAAGNVDLETVDAAGLTPVQAIRRGLEICREPMHSASNLFWLLEINRLAAAHGCGALLTGQGGNGGISWDGDLLCQSLRAQAGQLGWRGCLRANLSRRAPRGVLRLLRHYRSQYRKQEPWRDTAIHPSFAQRLDLWSRRRDEEAEYNPDRWRAARCEILRPGRSIVGALHAELGGAAGIDVRDPTADARVLAFCFSVPEEVYFDPETGMDRWLIREAMKGRLPDPVRLNRRRGRQAGDIVPRLRASAAEVEEALRAIAEGSAAEFLDVAWMRSAWETIQTEDSMTAIRLADRVLTRGIMAGLFVNGFESTQGTP